MLSSSVVVASEGAFGTAVTLLITQHDLINCIFIASCIAPSSFSPMPGR